MEFLNTILAFIAALTGILTLVNEIRKNRRSKIAIKYYINIKTSDIRKEIARNPSVLIKNVGIEWTAKTWIYNLEKYEETLNILKLEKDILNKPKIIKKLNNRLQMSKYLKKSLKNLTNKDEELFYKTLNNYNDISTDF
ncbi:hypothetical protein LPC11_12520 (plasmid) [Staphylococcus sp. HL28]|uniref:hypothetical protein n=1 Tax=Staphylococcus sp. HL28 TaxID=2897335 RepID=UPI001E3A8B54|nr:hypothetical protein [Staphylococcus sp. HL28]UGB07422.1 hypothetical protein LPC11_12520 [Staphylococcus sp. HL28]